MVTVKYSLVPYILLTYLRIRSYMSELLLFGRRHLRCIGCGLTQGQMISTQLVSFCLAIMWLLRALESLQCSVSQTLLRRPLLPW